MLRQTIQPGNTTRSQSLHITRPGRPLAGALLLVGTLMFLEHLSSGRQIDQKTIKSRLIVVESLSLDPAGGKLGAILGSDPNHQTSISFFNRETSSRLSIGLFGGDSPGLTMTRDTSKFKTRLSLNVLTTGPNFHIRDSAGELDLVVDSDGVPEATFSDTSGIRIALAGMHQNGGHVGIRFYDAAGIEMAHANTTDSMTDIALFDGHRHVRALMGLAAARSPAFLWYDLAIHALIELTEDGGGRPFIKLNDFETGESRTIK